LRNPQELFGFALDTLGLRGAPLAGGLLLAALDPAEITTSPAWRGVTAPSRATAPPIPRGLPRAVSSLPRAGGDAVLGWTTPGGPVALPAHWDAASGVATVSRALAEDVGVSG